MRRTECLGRALGHVLAFSVLTRLRLGETVTLETLGLEVTYEGRTTDGGVMVRVTHL